MLHWRVILVCLGALAIALIGGFGGGFGVSVGLDSPDLFGLYW